MIEYQYKPMLVAYGLQSKEIPEIKTLTRSLGAIEMNIKKQGEDHQLTDDEKAKLSAKDVEIQDAILKHVEYMKPDQWKHYKTSGEKPQVQQQQQQKQEVVVEQKKSGWCPISWAFE